MRRDIFHADNGPKLLCVSQKTVRAGPYQPFDNYGVPPVSGQYFYDADGIRTEQLFSAFMHQLRLLPGNKEFRPGNKQSGLRKFKEMGWLIVDATYEPVNGLDDKIADYVIVRDYPLLRDDLDKLIPDRSTPIILVKKNVCDILEYRLLKDGFNVINRGIPIYFPGSGQQNRFKKQFAFVIASYIEYIEETKRPKKVKTRVRRQKRTEENVKKPEAHTRLKIVADISKALKGIVIDSLRQIADRIDRIRHRPK